MGLNHHYRVCGICGSLGHGEKSCALYRLEEQKQALSATRPWLTVREPSDPAIRSADPRTIFLPSFRRTG